MQDEFNVLADRIAELAQKIATVSQPYSIDECFGGMARMFYAMVLASHPDDRKIAVRSTLAFLNEFVTHFSAKFADDLKGEN